MKLEEVRIENYRSIRELVMPMQPLTVVVGPNGAGKTNLYQALTLLQAASEGRLAQAILDGGGMKSVLWAGPRSGKAVRMRLDVTWSDYRYFLQCGLPAPVDASRLEDTWFCLDPEVKEEQIVHQAKRKALVFMERDHGTLWVRDTDGARIAYPFAMPISESALSQVREPDRYPELSNIRELFRGWRFYHHFPTDEEAPARRAWPSIRTTVLSVDGHDLASALGTIAQIGNDTRLYSSIERAFPGQRLILNETEDHQFVLNLQDPDLLRPLDAQELSDGTLQYLCLVAALLTPRPPLLMAFNEPETSLHPRLYEPLARLLVEASERSQIWLTTHSVALAEHVRKLSGTTPLELEKVDGETRIVGRTRFGFER